MVTKIYAMQDGGISLIKGFLGYTCTCSIQSSNQNHCELLFQEWTLSYLSIEQINKPVSIQEKEYDNLDSRKMQISKNWML